ncbi:hypothetical protein F4779DRAFT_616552 [Xylariaceae sp. FL0662B]|nr:hypothetical protein F4779DRAFT_616552 [Xylariaceae sp. FL0662B]
MASVTSAESVLLCFAAWVQNEAARTSLVTAERSPACVPAAIATTNHADGRAGYNADWVRRRILVADPWRAAGGEAHSQPLLNIYDVLLPSWP